MWVFWIIEGFTVLVALAAVYRVHRLATDLEGDVRQEVGRQLALRQGWSELSERRRR